MSFWGPWANPSSEGQFFLIDKKTILFAYLQKKHPLIIFLVNMEIPNISKYIDERKRLAFDLNSR